MEKYKDIKVSIILPIYNVGQYFGTCMESVINQSHHNLEIILVDDGSTDNSGKLADSYANKDKRIKVIHKPNGGVSSARNVGINLATGDYVCFSDPDDILRGDYVEYMLGLCIENKTEIAVCAEVFTPFMRIQPEEKLKIISGENAACEILYGRITVGCYSKMFNRSFLNQNNIRFLEDVRIGEGFNFNVYAFCKANKVALSQHKVYYYRLDNSTSAMTSFKIGKCEEGIKSIDIIYQKLPLHTKRLDNAVAFAKYSTTASMLDWMVNARTCKVYKRQYSDYTRIVRKYAIHALFSPTSKKQKIAAFLRMISPYMWAFIRRIAREIVLNNTKGQNKNGKERTETTGGG